MSDAVVKLGWDNSGARAGADEALRIAQSLRAKTDKTLAKVGNPMAMQKGGAGMIAMQVQDIAVQAQMGTNALQIFAQQGSQIASIFGPGGAVVGGVAAVAGALVYASQKSQELLNGLITGAVALPETLMKGMSSTNDIVSGLSEIQAKMDELRQARKDLQGPLPVLLGIAGLPLGGDFQGEKFAKIAAASGTLMDAQNLLYARMESVAQRELSIAQARLQGEEQLAAELERQLGLEKAIIAIRQNGLPANTQDRMIGNVVALAEAERAAEVARKVRADEENVGRLREELGALQFKRLQSNATAEQQILNLKKMQAAELEKFNQEAAGGPLTEARMLEIAAQRLRTAQQISDMEKAVEDSKKRQVQAAEAAFNNEAAMQSLQAAREAEERKRASTARADSDKELNILKLKAEGKMEAAAAAERELSILQKARQLAADQGIGMKAALDQARQRVDLEEKAAKRQEASAGRIQGYSRERQGGAAEASARAAKGMLDARARVEKSRESFGGLREFYRNQERDSSYRRALPVGRAFEGASRGNDAAVGLLARMVEVMESVNQNTGQLVAV